MRRKAITILFLSAAATLGAGCSGSSQVAYDASADRPLWSAGAGDALGASSFHKPVVVAAYEARRMDDTAYASVPTE